MGSIKFQAVLRGKRGLLVPAILELNGIRTNVQIAAQQKFEGAARQNERVPERLKAESRGLVLFWGRKNAPKTGNIRHIAIGVDRPYVNASVCYVKVVGKVQNIHLDRAKR